MPETDPTPGPADYTIEVHDQLPPDYKAEEKLKAAGRKESGEWASFWSYKIGALIDGIAYLVSQAAGIAKFALAKILPVISATEGENADSIAALNAAIISDVLSVSVDPNEIRELISRGATAEAFEIMGRKLLEGIAAKLIVEEQLSPEQGIKSAYRFMGFMTNWVIKEGFQKFMLDVIGIEWLDQWDGITDEMFRSLGLSRHARAAFRPFFDTILATPLEWHYNKKYRPKMLSTGEAVRAHLRGGLPLDELREVLARQGYSDKDIGHLIAAIELPLSDSDILRLVHYKELTQDQAVALMREKGYSEERAIQIFTAGEIGPADALIDRRKKIWLDAYLDDLVHQGEFENAIDQMPMGDREKQAWKDLAAIQRVIPRKKLSLAQMNTAFLHATVDLVEWRRFIQSEGYDDKSIQILQVELLRSLADQPKDLSAGQLRAAFLDGFITEADYLARLKAIGFTDADARILVEGAKLDLQAKQSKQKP